MPSREECQGRGGLLILKLIDTKTEYFQASPLTIEQCKQFLTACAVLHQAAWEDAIAGYTFTRWKICTMHVRIILLTTFPKTFMQMLSQQLRMFISWLLVVVATNSFSTEVVTHTFFIFATSAVLAMSAYGKEKRGRDHALLLQKRKKTVDEV